MDNEKKQKVVIVDNGYLMHRAIFSFRVNPSGVPVTYLYLRMMIACLNKLGLDYEDKIIVAMDSPLGSWRRAIDPQYKAQRKENREALENADWWKEIYKDFKEFNEKLRRAVPWCFVELPKVEADDWASVACRYFENEEVILVSSDRDWEQLVVYPNVKVFSILKKEFKDIPNGYKVLQEKIMKGDVSDNLLGAPQNDQELERRKKVVSLLELPPDLETAIRWQLSNLPIKTLDLNKIPYYSLRQKIEEIYLPQKPVVKKERKKKGEKDAD
jgi:5'-3' exonuclease